MKPIAYLSLLLVLMCVPAYAETTEQEPEQVEITTYYPAPYGDYDELTATGLTTNYVSFKPRGGTPGSWLAGEEADLIYSDGTKEFHYYNGTEWKDFSKAGWYVPSEVKVTDSAHNGNFISVAGENGYRAMYQWIQDNGCAGYHVCTSMELVSWQQTGHSIPLGTLITATSYYAWYQTGAYGTVSDCDGWGSSQAIAGPAWLHTGPLSDITMPHNHRCDVPIKVLCCK